MMRRLWMERSAASASGRQGVRIWHSWMSWKVWKREAQPVDWLIETAGEAPLIDGVLLDPMRKMWRREMEP